MLRKETCKGQLEGYRYDGIYDGLDMQSRWDGMKYVYYFGEIISSKTAT